MESAANWRKSSLEKCPPTKTYLSPLLLAEELPHRRTLRRGNTHRVRVRVRVGVRVKDRVMVKVRVKIRVRVRVP